MDVEIYIYCIQTDEKEKRCEAMIFLSFFC